MLQKHDWVERVFFFHHTDGPGQGNGGYGIVNEDLTPKPAHHALQAVVRAAAGVR